MKKCYFVFILVLISVISLLVLSSVSLFSCDATDVETALEKMRKTKKSLDEIIKMQAWLHCLICQEYYKQPETYCLLDTALEEANPNVRFFAVRLMYILEDSRAIERLQKHLETETQPDIRKLAEFAIKGLKERRLKGRLAFEDGKLKPRVSFNTRAKEGIYRVEQRGTKDYRVTGLYDIRQSIARDGFIHFVQPSYYASFMETPRFKFGLGFAHLEVYNKKEGFWKLYTLSDGFGPVCLDKRTYKGDMFNFKSHLAVKGCTHVFIFDKKTRDISRLTLEEFKGFKQSHASEKPLVDIGSLEWGELGRQKKAMHAGRLFSSDWFPGGGGLMRSNEKRMVVSTGTGLRVFDDSKEIGFMDSVSGLQGSRILDVAFRGDRLMVRYKNNVDIFATGGSDFPFKRLHRLDIPGSKEGERCIQKFDDTFLYIAQGKQYFIVRIDNGQTVHDTVLDSDVRKMDQDNRNIYLMTNVGISVWDKKTQAMESYRYLYPSSKKDTFIQRRESKHLRWAGKKGNRIVGTLTTLLIDGGSTSSVQFDIKNRKYLKTAQSYFASGNVAGRPPTYSHEGRRYRLEKIGNKVEIIEKGKGTAAHFKMMKEEPPRLFPMGCSYYHSPIFKNNPGYRLNGVCFIGDTLWLRTERGVFSFGIKTGEWSHFPVGRPVFRTHKVVINANMYGIYSDYFRIDRDTFQISEFSDIPFQQIRLSPCDAETAVFNPSDRISTFHFPTGQLRTARLNEPVSRFGFYENRILAAGEQKLWILNKNLEVVDSIIIEKKKKYKEYGDRVPSFLTIEGNRVWLVYRSRITNLDLDSGKQYHLRLPVENWGDNCLVLVDDDCIWYTLNSDIWRLDKQTGKAVCLTDEIFSMPGYFEIDDFTGIFRKGNYLYLLGDTGFCRLHREKFLLERSCLEIKECYSSAFFDDKLYALTMYGVFQIPFDILEKSFEYREIAFR